MKRYVYSFLILALTACATTKNASTKDTSSSKKEPIKGVSKTSKDLNPTDKKVAPSNPVMPPIKKNNDDLRRE